MFAESVHYQLGVACCVVKIKQRIGPTEGLSLNLDFIVPRLPITKSYEKTSFPTIMAFRHYPKPDKS